MKKLISNKEIHNSSKFRKSKVRSRAKSRTDFGYLLKKK